MFMFKPHVEFTFKECLPNYIFAVSILVDLLLAASAASILHLIIDVILTRFIGHNTEVDVM